MQVQTLTAQYEPVLALSRPVLKKNMALVTELCKKNRVKNLWVFGSVTTDKFKRGSDIDFLVEFEEMDVLDYADFYFGLLFGLEDSFKRKVDLTTVYSVQSPVLKKNVDRQKQLIYG